MDSRSPSDVDELTLLECLDTGKPLEYARDEIEDTIEYYVSVAQAHEGSHLPRGGANHVYIRNEPYGVVGQILPWNYPLNLFGWKVGAALAAGNTVVCKPSEEAPLSITRAAQLSAEVLPDGVLNVVNGFGTEAGASLTQHDDVEYGLAAGVATRDATTAHRAAADIRAGSI